MRFACVLVVLLVANVAHADRTAVVTVGGAFGAMGGESLMPDAAPEAGPVGLVRGTVAWERPSPPFLTEPGKSNFSGSFVPELIVGSFLEQDRAEGFVGIGLRAELRGAHNDIQPFGLTYKVGGYLVARALVLGRTQDAAYEFGLGEYFPRFSGFTRAGFEMTVISRPNYMESDGWQGALMLSLFAGWAP